jgi:hypothetical protein
VTRRTTALVGVAVVAAYVASAAIAGHLSPLARGPLLDGGQSQQPYHWVHPPTSLASTNVAPSSATADVPLGPKGSRALPGLVTSDKQVILILAAGVIPPHGSDTQVRIDITPVDPATLSSLGGSLEPFGNAYRVTGTYLPSKTPVSKLAPSKKLDVVLAYPVTASLYAQKHKILFSPTGTDWLALKSTDLVIQQQVEGQPPGMGYVVVGGTPGPSVVTSSPGVGSGGGTNTLAIALAVVAGAALLIGLGLVLRNGRTNRKP